MSNFVQAKISLKELALLSTIRQTPFGIVEVHIQNGDMDWVNVKKNTKLTERDGITAMKRESDVVAIIGESSIITREEVVVSYGKEKTDTTKGS